MYISVKDCGSSKLKATYNPNFLKIAPPGCVPLVRITTKSNVLLIYFCCRFWFELIVLWLFHPVFECVDVFAFIIKLPWFLRCFCSTVSKSHRIAAATVVPWSTTPRVCTFSLTLPRTRRGSLFFDRCHLTLTQQKGICAARPSQGLINMYVQTNYQFCHL